MTRGQKVKSREEREIFKFISSVLRREREIQSNLFREEKEFFFKKFCGKSQFFLSFEKRKEILKSFLQFREEKEKYEKNISSFKGRKRNSKNKSCGPRGEIVFNFNF